MQGKLSKKVVYLQKENLKGFKTREEIFMNNKLKKTVASVLTATMMMTAGVPAFAETNAISYNMQSMTENINNLIIVDEGVIINGAYYTRAEFTNLLYQAIKVNNQDSGTAQTCAAIAAGAYFLPGIGQVLIAATGVITIAGVTIAEGTWLYETITEWLSDSEAQEIAAIKAKIPSRFRTDSGDVDLSQFDEKVNGSSVKYKEDGGWTVEKDTSGHGGSAWKLKDKSGKRIASLDKDGKVLRG